VVQHAQARDEVEALGRERRVPQVRLDHRHVRVVPEVARRGLDGRRAVERHLGGQVVGQDAGEPSLAAAGVEPDLVGEAVEVEITEVDLREVLVLVTHLVEGVPLEAEAGQRALGGADPLHHGGEVHEAVPLGEPVPTVADDLGRTIGHRRPAPRAPQPIHDQVRHCLLVVVEHIPTPVRPPLPTDPSL